MSSTKDVTCRSDPAHLWPGMSPVTSLPPPPQFVRLLGLALPLLPGRGRVGEVRSCSPHPHPVHDQTQAPTTIPPVFHL